MKSKTHYIAKLQNPTTLEGLYFELEREPDDGCIATVKGVHGLRLARAQLVSLRDQIDQWLEIHEE